MTSPLLKTKLLFPQARAQIVARPRLVERLSHGLKGALTLISAPAGYGKTTLLSEWRSGIGRTCPAAWLTLDPGDNDTVRFLFYLASAVDTIKSGLAASALSLFQSSQPPQFGGQPPLEGQTPPAVEAVLTALMNDLSTQPREIALVLEDYHHIDAPAVHQALEFLLQHQPPNLHLVLLTRSDPPLPLARLRVRGQLTEIRAADLRFTPAESAVFLQQVMGIHLSAADAAALEARTEGWIAALQLAALSLQGLEAHSASSFISAFQGSHPYIVDYLVEEVLSRQPEDVRTFLRGTCILEWMNGPLCDAVLEDPAAASQRRLEELERANLFVVALDSTHRWFRYHLLFADLLRQRLSQSLPAAEINALHLRASAWFEQEGYIAEAVQHALAGGDAERAAALLERAALQLIFRGELSLMRRGLKALPQELLRAHPMLCLAQAWMFYIDLVPDFIQWAEEWLQHAETQLGAADEPDFAMSSAALRAYLAFDGQQDPRAAAEHARQALERLPVRSGGQTSSGELALRSALVFLLGQAQLSLGDLPVAERALTEARQLAAACGSTLIANGAAYLLAALAYEQGRLQRAAAICKDVLQPAPTSAALLALLGSVLLEWNRIDEAETHLVAGLEAARTDTISYQFAATVGCIRLRQSQEDVAGALELIEHGLRTLPGEFLKALRARLWLAQAVRLADLAKAEGWARECGVTLEHSFVLGSIVPIFSRDVERLALARLLIAQRRLSSSPEPDLQPLQAYLQRAAQEAEDAGWLTRVIEFLLLQALAHQAVGDLSAAMTLLKRALALAEPEGFVRLFLDEGLPMCRLLRWTLQHASPSEYAARLLAEFERAAAPVQGPALSASQPASLPAVSGPQRMGASPLVESLSPRELEVLGLIAAGRANKEIAAELVISLQTVKRHTVNIFRKLNVRNRTEAVALARELRLL